MGLEGATMGDLEERRLARRYVEERIARIQSELAFGEACGREFRQSRELEEELLEELAELELSLLTGRIEPYAR